MALCPNHWEWVNLALKRTALDKERILDLDAGSEGLELCYGGRTEYLRFVDNHLVRLKAVIRGEAEEER